MDALKRKKKSLKGVTAMMVFLTVGSGKSRWGWVAAVFAVVLIGVGNPGAAQAQITGEIGFATVFTPADGSFASASLATATSLDYNGNGLQDSASASVIVATGDFAAEGIGLGDSGTVFDFTFNPLPGGGVNPLWSISGDFSTFSFALSSVTIDTQNANTLSLIGTGTINSSDFDPTPGTWSFTGNPLGSTGLFIFSAGTAVAPVTPVPEPEIYAMMAAGLGLMGFVARRRNRNGTVA